MPLSFDAGDSSHRAFVLYAAQIWGRVRGASGEEWERDSLEEVAV